MYASFWLLPYRKVSAYRGDKAGADRGADIRVLVALEDDYRTYRETIAVALRILRPDAEVESATLGALEEELERFDPQVVICGSHEEAGSASRPAWIELSLDPTRPAKICVGGRRSELVDPTLEALLKVIDGFE